MKHHVLRSLQNSFWMLYISFKKKINFIALTGLSQKDTGNTLDMGEGFANEISYRSQTE
jgi:hypothetical protein